MCINIMLLICCPNTMIKLEQSTNISTFFFIKIIEVYTRYFDSALGPLFMFNLLIKISTL